MPNKNSFVIAQLTDLHLTPTENKARSEASLFGALKGMNDRFRRFIRCDEIQKADRVLVTGDVTDRGDIETWRLFWTEISIDLF